jgi:hypothetical protein
LLATPLIKMQNDGLGNDRVGDSMKRGLVLFGNFIVLAVDPSDPERLLRPCHERQTAKWTLS